jgi:excisionase family DNA binding protein
MQMPTSHSRKPESLLSIREAAEVLGCSERHLYGLTCPRGDLPAVRLGRKVAYDPADLREFVLRRKDQPDAP